MDYKIYPLSITTTSWPIFIKVCQDNFGFSPTRQLDDSSIKLETPAAFLIALQHLFKDTKDTRLLDHIHLGFLAIVDEEVLIQIFDVLVPLDIRYKAFDNKRLVIISGALSDWKNSTYKGCSRLMPITFRKLMNQVHSYLCVGGFGFIFELYDVFELEDGTFILE